MPDASKRQNALNFLLGVGLFKSLVDSKGSVSFRAVTKNELAACVIVITYISTLIHLGV